MKRSVLIVCSGAGEAGEVRLAIPRSATSRLVELGSASLCSVSGSQRPDAVVFLMQDTAAPAIEGLRGLKDLLGPDVPVIAITGDNSLTGERAVRSIGVYYYLVAPFALRDLRFLLRSALRGTRNNRTGFANARA